MTREDVKKIFPEATDEQITAFLNQSNSDVAREKAKAQKMKEDAEKAEALEKELEELKQQNMTEAERLEAERKKEKEAVDKELADLKAALAESNKKALTSEITSMFANAGLSTETYASAIKAYASAPYEKPEDAMKEVETFVKGVSAENKTALDTAKAAWEKEALENTPNPGGGSGSKTTVKSDAAEFAKAYSAKKNQETKSVDGNAPVNI